MTNCFHLGSFYTPLRNLLRISLIISVGLRLGGLFGPSLIISVGLRLGGLFGPTNFRLLVYAIFSPFHLSELHFIKL